MGREGMRDWLGRRAEGTQGKARRTALVASALRKRVGVGWRERTDRGASWRVMGVDCICYYWLRFESGSVEYDLRCLFVHCRK